MPTSNQVTKDGVTATFNMPVNYHYYVSWEPEIEVLPGLQVISMDPPCQDIGGRIINGAQLGVANVSNQGYDSHNSDMPYVPAMNVDPGITGQPIDVAAGDRIFKSVSLANPPSNGRPVLDQMVIFTFVDTLSAPGSFRPGYHGSTTTFTESGIDWSRLPSLPRTASVPPLSSLQLGTVIDYSTEWTQRAIHPQSQMPTYGGNLAQHVADMMLACAMDFTQAEKRDMVISLIQYGVDVFDVITSPGLGGGTGDFDFYYNNGGHNAGRHAAMRFAGFMFNDSMIQDFVFDRFFQEIQQTFEVNSAHVPPYQSSDIGMYEWTTRIDNLASLDPTWDRTYRDINGSYIATYALCQNIYGMPNIDVPMKGYAERYWDVEEGRGHPTSNPMSPFAIESWRAYYNQAQPEPPTTAETVSGQVIWTGGDAGEDKSIPQVNVSGALGSVFNVDEDGNWSIFCDTTQPAIQQMDQTQYQDLTFTVTNADGVTTQDVRWRINGTDDVPTVDSSSVITVETDEP